MHRIKEINVDVPVPTTSLSSYFFGCHLLTLQYKLLRPMDTRSAIFLFLKENVCSGYSLEAALSNVNDSFTSRRLMKRPKTFFDLAHDEYPQLTFFREICRKAFQQCSRTPALFKCCSFIFDRITCLNRGSCEQCRL